MYFHHKPKIQVNLVKIDSVVWMVELVVHGRTDTHFLNTKLHIVGSGDTEMDMKCCNKKEKGQPKTTKYSEKNIRCVKNLKDAYKIYIMHRM